MARDYRATSNNSVQPMAFSKVAHSKATNASATKPSADNNRNGSGGAVGQKKDTIA